MRTFCRVVPRACARRVSCGAVPAPPARRTGARPPEAGRDPPTPAIIPRVVLPPRRCCRAGNSGTAPLRRPRRSIQRRFPACAATGGSRDSARGTRDRSVPTPPRAAQLVEAAVVTGSRVRVRLHDLPVRERPFRQGGPCGRLAREPGRDLGRVGAPRQQRVSFLITGQVRRRRPGDQVLVVHPPIFPLPTPPPHPTSFAPITLAMIVSTLHTLRPKIRTNRLAFWS